MLTDEEAAAIEARATAGKMLPREYPVDIGYLLADRRTRIAREAATQATLAQTREALRKLWTTVPAVSVDFDYLVAREEALAALGLPQDRTVLDAALAEARRQGAREAARRCVAAAKALDAGHEGRKRMGVPGPCAILSAWHDGACSAWAAVEAEAARIEAGNKEETP